MTEMITLPVSDELVQRAKISSMLTGKSVETLLLEWMERGVGESSIEISMPVIDREGNEAAAQALYEMHMSLSKKSQE